MSRFLRVDDPVSDERTPYFRDLLPDHVIESPGCRFIGAADENGIPEGVIAFSMQENNVDILHVEVYPELRRRGIGTSLVRILLKYLSLAEMPFILQAVYSDSGAPEDAVTDAFFRSMPDFEVVSGGRIYTVTPDTIWNPDRLDHIQKYACPVKSFTELTKEEKGNLINDLEKRGSAGMIPEAGEKVIPDLSLCHLEDGHCTACVIFKESGIPDTIELAFLMSGQHKGDHLAGVLNEVTKRLGASYRDKSIVFSVINRDSELVAKRFFADGVKVNEILTAISFGEI